MLDDFRNSIQSPDDEVYRERELHIEHTITTYGFVFCHTYFAFTWSNTLVFTDTQITPSALWHLALTRATGDGEVNTIYSPT